MYNITFSNAFSKYRIVNLKIVIYSFDPQLFKNLAKVQWQKCEKIQEYVGLKQIKPHTLEVKVYSYTKRIRFNVSIRNFVVSDRSQDRFFSHTTVSRDAT